jgi:SAM-dependent methyltransferase
MRWPRRRRGGRLPSLGHDYDSGHRRYVQKVGPGAELWLHRKPFFAPPNYELERCLHTFAHLVTRLNLGLRSQVLDVGCGPGWLSELLAQCGYWVTGVDISEDMVRIAEQRVAAIPRPLGEGIEEPVAEFFAMPVRELPWSDRFDAAVLYDTLHHFDDEVETLRVINRTLVPGGRIYIEEGVRPPPGSEAERTLLAEMEEYGTLESPFDPEYLVEVLEAAEFEDVTRFARFDELLEIGAERDAVALLHQRMRYPDLNTIVATKPLERSAEEGAFRARIEYDGHWEDRGADVVMWVTVTNEGRSYWPAPARFPYPAGAVMVGPHVERGRSNRVELPRVPLPHAVSPGEAVTVGIVLPKDAIAEGEQVRVDLVREGIAWFTDLGSEPLVLTVPRG